LRLDLTNECLWCGARAIPLRPKTFAVLRYLAEHPGQLVTQEALLDAVWPNTAVGAGGLMVCIRELRRALGDDAKAPRFIETVHRRGYRFIGSLRVTACFSPSPPPLLMGRETELEHLHRWLDKALERVRQVVFVTGEAGLGKTTLVDAFAEAASRWGKLWIGRGQCIEHYGAGEAYMPVLEALGRLCREPGGQDLVALLARQAPTWLVQMPGLLSGADLEALQRRVLGATRERMLRELAEAIEVLTAERPLVLVLEDLHWSDYSTLDLVALLARRQETARLLLLGTYRPEDVLRRGHPLQTVQQELHMHGSCAILPLTFLNEEAIAAYLTARFPGLPLPGRLARFVHQRTDGNPLFMVNVVESWLARGVLVERDGQWVVPVGVEALQAEMPESLRQMLEQQLNRLTPEEQRVVEAGSVAGMDFSAAAVAAGVGQEVVQVEACCASLARRGQLLRVSSERVWPDGTVAGCYSFIHALYQEAVYQRLPVAQRLDLHRRIGERMEAGYGAQGGDIAAELAMHFEQGRDYRRAVTYLQHAADTALRRYAYAEAVDHLTTALRLLQTLPNTPDRVQQELGMQTTLGSALTASRGYGAPEVAHVYSRALELCRQMVDTPQLFSVLRGLSAFYQQRGELQTALALAEQLLTLAQRTHDPALLLRAHQVQGSTLFYLGELSPAHRSLKQGMAGYAPERHRVRAFSSGLNTGVVCLGHAAWTLWSLGYPDQALRQGHAALALAQELSHPHSLVYALHFNGAVHQFRREVQAVQERAEAVLALSAAQGLTFWSAYGTIMRGWALAMQGQWDEGTAQLRQGLDAWRATGAELGQTYFLALQTEVCKQAGQIEAGLATLAEALAAVDRTGERFYEAELHRLKGELLLAQAGHGQPSEAAEACFQQALDVARCHQAKSLELRAAISLGRLWQQQGKRDAAHLLLAEVYGWFTEGFDTADLCEARALLAELSRP
jgi:predicted ATPase/DNA-binding winged helix-turn-helix (wHTH) protein